MSRVASESTEITKPKFPWWQEGEVLPGEDSDHPHEYLKLDSTDISFLRDMGLVCMIPCRKQSIKMPSQHSCLNYCKELLKF